MGDGGRTAEDSSSSSPVPRPPSPLPVFPDLFQVLHILLRLAELLLGAALHLVLLAGELLGVVVGEVAEGAAELAADLLHQAFGADLRAALAGHVIHGPAPVAAATRLRSAVGGSGVSKRNRRA